MRDALENLGYVALAVLAYLLLMLVVTVVLGRLELVWALCKGFLLLSVFLLAEQAVQGFFQRILRLSELEHLGVVVFNLLVTIALCLAWAAFIGLEVTRAIQNMGWLGSGFLYALGLVGAWLGFGVVTGFFIGTLYRTTGLVVTALGFVAFAVFPKLAEGGFGWFFALW